MRSVQQIVDQASHVLQRPVLADDAALRPLACSAGRTMDGTLAATARPDAARWLTDIGIAAADQPVRVCGGEPLGLAGRWCAPIRHRGALLGFLWVLAEDEPCADHIEQLERFAGEVAYAIARDRLRRIDAEPHESLRQLVGDSVSESYAAAARLVASGVVRMEQSVLLLVAEIGDGPHASSNVLAGMATQRFAATCGVRHVLHAVWDHSAACLVAHDDGDVLRHRAERLGHHLLECLAHARPGHSRDAVGVGSVSASLAEARRSFDHAVWAAHVASCLPDRGMVATWDDLGVFQLLRNAASADTLPTGLEALFASPNAPMLLETLEVYLDTGGDAQATAAQLCLARGSLYYRLRRIEELAQVDLRDGRERLTLHLGLTLARLAGRWSGVRHDVLQLAS